jgi:hypothetical protein
VFCACDNQREHTNILRSQRFLSTVSETDEYITAEAAEHAAEVAAAAIVRNAAQVIAQLPAVRCTLVPAEGMSHFAFV